MQTSGVDSAGTTTYSNPQQLWQSVDADKQSSWYGAAVSYWDGQEASYNGVLGGYGELSEPDIAESEQLLLRAFGSQLEAAKSSSRHLVALDCGAGVGRVSENLLLRFFQEVDLVEPSAHLIEEARRKLTGSSVPRAVGRAVGFFQMGLQDMHFPQPRYDVIWIQWALLYLTDEDALAFFERCKTGLLPGGIIVVKENICAKGFVVDKDDASLTRSNPYLLKLFAEAQLQVALNIQQRNFPKEIFKVRMYVLRPKGP